MIKNIIGGIAIGIANVIPGVSGGTMMVILGIFNRMMEAISGIFKRVNPNRKDDIIFIFQVLVGAAIGIVGFAKILEILFEYYPTQTIYWFIGLIAFSIPLFVKGEMKGEKLAIVPFVCGLAIIFGLEFLNPGEGNTVVNAIGFNMGELVEDYRIGDRIDVVGVLEVNTFNGVDTLQINMKDIMRAI